jgi:hypothetical protein
VRQGSVTPTHYNVIYDSMGLKPDYYQRLTYKLCHLYFNWPVSSADLLSMFPSMDGDQCLQFKTKFHRA